MKLVIAAPANGVELKNALKAHLQNDPRVASLVDLSSPDGTYPQLSFAAAQEVAAGRADRAILICGTGIGISLAANKVKGIRAAVCSEPYSAKMSREHNNANMIAFGARVVGEDLAKMIVDSWLDAKFQGGRHAERVALIDEIEETGELSCE